MTSTPLQVVREVRFLSAATMLAFMLAALPGFSQTSIVRISADNLTNSDSDHKTEVEPDTFAWGSTLVSTFHVARRPGSIGWGSGDIGYSTSTDGGKTWKYGLLPGLTVNYKNGNYGAAADPSVAYDAKHGQWLISTLPLAGLGPNSGLIGDVAVSRSTNGLNWSNPIIIDKTHLDDKNWTVCDNTTSSPYYGNCYTEWDQAYGTGDVLMSVSSNGGQTWGPGLASSDHAGGLGGEPLVQPNGTVIVPFEGGGIDVFSSTNGGVSWGKSQSIATIQSHFVAAGLRNPNLPSAGIDGAGNVYVVWSDCRFRSKCASNDIVMSTSSNGTTWSAVTRIPIDPTTSTVDHFIPGIGVDPTTSGANAHLTIVYYYYPNSSNGEGIFQYALETLIKDTFTPVEWEGYTPYDKLAPRPPLKQHKQIAVDAKILDQYVGRYGLNPSLVLTVRREANHLSVQENDEPKQQLMPESEVDFFSASSDDTVTFVKDARGRVTGLTLHLNGRDIPVKKIN